MVTVCHFSDWIEVDQLPNTLSTTVINCTKAHFARHGIPDICHTDNGPQFISNDFITFAKTYGVKHTRSAPYYPKGNGKAEAAVKVAKSMLKKCDDFYTALLNYRNTPQQGHLHSPAQRLMSRRTKTTLPTGKPALIPTPVNPDITKEHIIQKRITAKEIYDRTAGPIHAKPEIGTYVDAKPPPQRKGQPWTYGQIFEKDEHSYTLKTPNNTVIRRNRLHVTPAAAPSKPLVIHTYINRTLPTPQPATTTLPTQRILQAQSPPHPATPTTTPDQLQHKATTTDNNVNRPQRTRRMPVKFQDYVMT